MLNTHTRTVTCTLARNATYVLQAAVVVKTAQISADKRMLAARNLKRMMVTAMIMIAHALTAVPPTDGKRQSYQRTLAAVARRDKWTSSWPRLRS